MAKRSRKGKISHAAAVKRAKKAARTRARHFATKHSNPGRAKARRTYRRYHRHSNPQTIIKYRTRNSGKRKSYRRHRNPGMMNGVVGKAVGVIGGAFLTNMLMGFVPASLNTGIMGYVSTAIVATLQGKAVGKLLKNPALGNDMALGGYVYLALRVAQDMFPSIALPFKLSGLGIIGPSSFFTPQVPLPGSMGQFVNPQQLTAAIPVMTANKPGMSGMTRRVGRMR